MKILRLKVRNFKPFRDLTIPDEDTDLPDGLILIEGLNSTGKSSLFEAILWGIWGADSVSLTNDELVSFASTHCQVIVTFQVAGTQYKIDRSYNPADGMAVVLFAKKDAAWKRIADKSRSVATKLDEVLSLELKQALSTLLVRQGEVAVIANATPSVLRNLLVRVYDIEILNRMTGHLEELENDLKLRVNALESDYQRPEHIQQQITDNQARIQHYKEGQESKEKEIKSVEKHLGALPEIDTIKQIHQLDTHLENNKKEIENDTQQLDKDLTQAGLVSANKKTINARIESLKREASRIKTERKDTDETKQKVDQEIGKISGTSTDLKEKIQILETAGTGDVIACPTCSKPLSASERKKLISEYKTTIKEGKTRTKQLETERAQYVATSKSYEARLFEISRSDDATARVAETQNKVDDAQKKARDTVSELSEVLQSSKIKTVEDLLKKYDVSSLSDLQDKVARLETSLDALKADTSEVDESILREEIQISELEGRRTEMEKRGKDIEELEVVSEHAKYVRRKLVNGFVTDFVFQKRLIGIIRGATNSYVRSFTNEQYTSIDLEPTPAKGRSGPGLILKIWDERDKAWKRTSQLSYGDRTAISLGLRLGISRTMSSIRPLKDSPILIPRVRTVLLDEPLGGLDKLRREAVVRTLVNDQSFEQILLITHTDVQGWEGVPVIEVSKTGTSSNAVLKM
ncbi:MAG: SMC family ATPase [Candidatus Thorarchaeota archaeon]|nr:MAG: SMC family ATPase [Candidatus Thorarchaeota archaeon]